MIQPVRQYLCLSEMHILSVQCKCEPSKDNDMLLQLYYGNMKYLLMGDI